MSHFVCADGDVEGIKEHLIDELDYVLLPTDGWNKLVSWYGLAEGQEPIARQVRLSKTTQPDQIQHNTGCPYRLGDCVINTTAV